MEGDGPESSDGSEVGELEEGRWLAWADERGMLHLANLPPPALVGRLGTLQPLHSMRLLPGETVTQVPLLERTAPVGAELNLLG